MQFHLKKTIKQENKLKNQRNNFNQLNINKTDPISENSIQSIQKFQSKNKLNGKINFDIEPTSIQQKQRNNDQNRKTIEVQQDVQSWNYLLTHFFEANGKKMQRFSPLLSIFLLNCLFNIYLIIPPVYMLYTLNSDFKRYFATIHYSMISLFFLLSGIYTIYRYGKRGVIEFIMMNFLLDGLMLNYLVVCIGFVGLFQVTWSAFWFDYVNTIQVPLMQFFFISNFRLFLKWTILQKWQVILWKISFFIGGVTYFMIGSYFMIVNYQLTGGYNPTLDTQLKNFSLLFIFSNFSLFCAIYELICANDKTNDMSYEYIIDMQSDQKSQGQKLQAQNKKSCSHCQHCKMENKQRNQEIFISPKSTITQNGIQIKLSFN